MPGLNVAGGGDLIRRLQNLGDRAPGVLAEGVWRGELKVKREAKRRCPVGVSVEVAIEYASRYTGV